VEWLSNKEGNRKGLAMKKKIRVGIIHCDAHGMYYAALMDEHDPILLREPELGRGVHFYFYTIYNDPKKMTVPKIEGYQVMKLWAADRKRAENLSRVFYGKPEVCETFEEVSDDVDLVFIADGSGDGSSHLELATPSIKKGIPTFIDKPLAHNVKDAHAIIRLANKYKTPVMSLSMLREIPHFTLFKNRFAEIEEPEFGIIKGGGTDLAGQIHAISLAQHLFGNGVESVECMGQNPLAYIHLNYGNKPKRPKAGVVLNCDSGGTYHCAFYASAYSKWGAIHSPGIGDYEFPWGAARILEKIKQMVKTKKPQASYDEMIENIAVATAAREAQKTGKTVYLKDVL